MKNTPDKRYLVFTIEQYEACGGMNDCPESFDTYEEAKEYYNSQLHCHKHI